MVAFLLGHFHGGLRGWSDTADVQEVVVPSACWARDGGLREAPGSALEEFRLGYVRS